MNTSSDYEFLSNETRIIGKVDRRHRQSFASLLLFYRTYQRFPDAWHDVPPDIIDAAQESFEVDQPVVLDLVGRTAKRFRAQIRGLYNIRPSTVEDAEKAKAFVLDTLSSFPTEEDAAQLLRRWYREHALELPASARQQRLVSSCVKLKSEESFAALLSNIPDTTRVRIDRLLDNADSFGLLRSDPGGGKQLVDAVYRENEKLTIVKSIVFGDLGLERTPQKTLQRLKQQVSREDMTQLRRRHPETRYPMMVIYCWVRQAEIIDAMVDLFIQIVNKIKLKASSEVRKEQQKEYEKVQGKVMKLFRIAEAVLHNPDGVVRDVIHPVVSEETIGKLVQEFEFSKREFKTEVQQVIRSKYKHHYRQILPILLDALSFYSNNERYRPVIEALEYLQGSSRSQTHIPVADVPIKGILSKKEQQELIDTDGRGVKRIHRTHYEISVFQALRNKLRCREIWVDGGFRWRNPDDDTPQDFGDNRDAYIAALGHELTADAFVDGVKAQMEEALARFDRELPRNDLVSFRPKSEKRIKVAKLVAKEDPPNLHLLHQEMLKRWDLTGLLDVLKETELRLGFTDEFTSTAPTERLDRTEIRKRLLLVLYGMGTNTGLKGVLSGDHGCTYEDLKYIKRRYVHAAGLRNAIARVANGVLEARHASIFGEATTACASDSKRFGTYDQNLQSQYHRRYAATGTMIYWHVSTGAVCIHSKLKSPSASEAAAAINGVLRHATRMEVTQQYVDSHGQSEVAFAFCHLLGFKLMPRLKRIAYQRLYRPEAGKPGAYPHLGPVLTQQPIRWELIAQQYDEMMKYATALKEGTADTEALLLRFTRNNVQHPTYKALAELGRAIKTIFLCEYLGSEAVRREVNEGLNVVENWNSANNFIFFGNGSEIQSNQLHEQETSMLALHLLQMSLVYVNTLMIQDVLDDGAWMRRMTERDLQALTPLVYAHINPYGSFDLDLEERIPLAA